MLHGIRQIASIVLIVAMCVAAAELAGTAAFFYDRGGLVYLNQVKSPTELAPSAPTLVGPTPYKVRLHPYFGYTGPYSAEIGTLHTNSLGFVQREPLTIPYLPKSGELVVAIFGGSVAGELAIGDDAKSFGDLLRAKLSRRVTVINMAQGSGKQPQQLLELAYLLAIGQRIDLAINVDGFNEFANGLDNYRANVDPSLPTGYIVGALAHEMRNAISTPRYYELAYRTSSAQANVAYHSARAEAAVTGLAYAYHSAQRALNVGAQARYGAEYQQFLHESTEWEAQKHAIGIDLPPQELPEKWTERLYNLWLASSLQMRGLANTNGIAYLHIVQPNQYFSDHHFDVDEAKIALAMPDDHAFRRGTQLGYASLTSHAAELDRLGIVSGIHLFDNESAPMYRDACCHYTAAGAALFAEFVAHQAQKLVMAPRARVNPYDAMQGLPRSRSD